MMIAERGKCTFATKAKHAQDASAAGLLIVNNEDGIMHPPGPDGKGLGERPLQNNLYSDSASQTSSGHRSLKIVWRAEGRSP